MEDASMPTVKVNAGNDGSDAETTGISVLGFDFPPDTDVNVKVAGQDGSAHVGADGTFDVEFSVQPPLQCNSIVRAVVLGGNGIEVKGEGNVFCP
jgi:hypothetical protein